MNIKIKRSQNFTPQLGTSVAVGVNLSLLQTKSQEDYIKKYLIIEMADIVKNHQELSWVLMVAGIELLGRYISSDKNSVEDEHGNQDYFRAGLRLFRNEYQRYNTNVTNPQDLWKKLRCGLGHLTFPKDAIIISEKVNSGKNLEIVGGKLVLFAEDFYEDFKTACEKVVDMLKNNQIQPKFHFNTVMYKYIGETNDNPTS